MATQDDFAAAKYPAPVAVYCGSVPKFKPRYRALRGGSIDSNLHIYGSSWTTEEEASFQSILTTKMKKQQSLRGGSGKPLYPRASPPLDGWASQASTLDLGTGDVDDPSHLSHQTLTQDPQEREVSSAALETIQIKDKLKMRRMSEGLLASQRHLTDCSDPKELTRKAAVSRSDSQSILVTSKPMPPIRKSPPSSESSRMSDGEQERGENGTSCDDSGGNNVELMSNGKGCEDSPLPSNCSNGNGKKSLRMAVIPPVPKSSRPSDGAPDSAAVPLPSSHPVVFQEVLEIRPRSGSRSEDKTLRLRDLQTLEPVLPVLQPHGGGGGGVKSAGHLCEPVSPLAGHPPSQAKEMDDHLSDDDLESNGRIKVVLSKSAQKKIQEKRMRQMELLQRQREQEREMEKSLQLPPQSVDPEDAAEESFGSPPANGTASVFPSLSCACRQRAGTALRKRVNRPSLPSIPVINQGGSFPRKSSAVSLPAIPEFVQQREKLECEEAQEARPFPNPDKALLNALTWLSNDDWEQKAKGLSSVRCLATCHSEVLLPRLHDVSLAVTKEVNNLRSKVSRFAISTLGDLFSAMKKHMDHEVDEVARVLLQRMGDTNVFIQKAASRSLGIMVESVTPARAMTALMASGVQHRNVLVRKCAAEHLLTAMERIGAQKLLSGNHENIELLVRTLVKLAQDSHQDTRCYGRKMIYLLMSHPKMDKYLKQAAPLSDLEKMMATLQQKKVQDQECEPPATKDHRKTKNSGLTMSKDNLPSDRGLKSGSDVPVLRCQKVHLVSLWTAEETEQLKDLYELLTAKDFQKRIEGVGLLLEHCKNSPQFISTNILHIFDIFAPRLQDFHKKVKQQALEALGLMITMLKDALHPVLVALVGAITDNLNSKHSGIYTAAAKAMEASVTHLAEGHAHSLAVTWDPNPTSGSHLVDGANQQINPDRNGTKTQILLSFGICPTLSSVMKEMPFRWPLPDARVRSQASSPDNTLLMQELSHRVPHLSGQALLDVTECLSVLVTSVYCQKPQAIKRYALPTLWFFLGNSVLPVRSGNVRAVVTKLAETLYLVMGSQLKEYAATQSPRVVKSLWGILDLNVG